MIKMVPIRALQRTSANPLTTIINIIRNHGNPSSKTKLHIPRRHCWGRGYWVYDGLLFDAGGGFGCCCG